MHSTASSMLCSPEHPLPHFYVGPCGPGLYLQNTVVPDLGSEVPFQRWTLAELQLN